MSEQEKPMRIIEGVTPQVNRKMNAVKGTILREDGLIQRQCEHGARHPVGSIHAADTREVSAADLEAHQKHGCCDEQCCQQWLLKTATKATVGAAEA